jgi:hypothetical protein
MLKYSEKSDNIVALGVDKMRYMCRKEEYEEGYENFNASRNLEDYLCSNGVSYVTDRVAFPTYGLFEMKKEFSSNVNKSPKMLYLHYFNKFMDSQWHRLSSHLQNVFVQRDPRVAAYISQNPELIRDTYKSSIRQVMKRHNKMFDLVQDSSGENAIWGLSNGYINLGDIDQEYYDEKLYGSFEKAALESDLSNIRFIKEPSLTQQKKVLGINSKGEILYPENYIYISKLDKSLHEKIINLFPQSVSKMHEPEKELVIGALISDEKVLDKEKAEALGEKEIKEIIKVNPRIVIEFVKYKKLNVGTLLYALEEDPYLIGEMENPSTTLQIKAVSVDSEAIYELDKPCDKAQKIAVDEDVDLISAIENPCVDVQMRVAEEKPALVKSIKEPCVEVQRKLLENNQWGNIEYLNKLHPELIIIAMENDINVEEFFEENSFTEEEKLKLVKLKPSIMKKFEEIPFSVRMEAVKRDGSLGSYRMHNVDEKDANGIYLEAAKQSGYYILKGERSKEIQIQAVRTSPFSIKRINDPYISVQLEAIRREPNAIKAISDPAEDVQLELLEIAPELYKYIKNPTEATKLKLAKEMPKGLKTLSASSALDVLETYSKDLKERDVLEEEAESVILIKEELVNAIIQNENFDENESSEEYEKMDDKRFKLIEKVEVLTTQKTYKYDIELKVNKEKNVEMFDVNTQETLFEEKN